MDRRPVSFFADGLRLDGDLWLPRPRRPGERRPAVVACSGYQGLKAIHPARFARALVPAGYACLAFDYRGFGRSEGERGRLVPQEQAEDVRAAVGFLEAADEIDPRRIALVGWGLGGGVAVAAAAEDPRVAAVAAVNAIGDGERSTRAMHDHDSWRALLERVAADCARRICEGRSELVDPFAIIRLDPVTRAYVEKELVKTVGFGALVSLESVDYLLRFRPETVVDRISPRPFLVVHGSENRLHLPTESDELFRRAREPKAQVLLEGGGHTEWMHDDHPTFRRLVLVLEDFLASSLPTDKEAASGGRDRK
jgi:pimeloyl-ACP methyl ester carboxylesterase